MTFRISTGARNGLLSSGIDTMFDAGVLDIRVGSPPALADDAPTGTLLASITLPSPWLGLAVGGQISKAGVWSDTSADNTGTAGWFRVRLSGDSGTSSSTALRMDGTLSLVAGGGDWEMDTTSVVVGGTVTISAATFIQPAA